MLFFLFSACDIVFHFPIMAFRRENLGHEGFRGIGVPQDRRAASRVTPKLFDVFISHQGDAPIKAFALQLHKSLGNNGIEAFFDSKALITGDFFPSALENAICSSKVQITIFSKEYAGSPWCLTELALILQTKAKIIPVFYDVEPSVLRHCKGVYANAFAKHADRYLDELPGWKEALKFVSYIHGEELTKHNGDQESLCRKLVSDVVKEVERTKLSKLEVAKHPVGVEDVVKDFERECSQQREGRETEDKVEMVGIFGTVGSGKTTLAIELFNQKQSEYDGSCFLNDVRDASVPSLQNRLLKDLIRDSQLPQFYSTAQGKSSLRNNLERTRSSRFLIVLDDVDNVNQLDALLIRDVFNPRSLVIVTTRDEGLLIQADIIIRYKLKTMLRDNSIELFCWSAFNRPYPPSEFRDLVESFVDLCGGLPLSLQVTGGLVSGRNYKDWELVFADVRKTPPDDIKERLRISFEGLRSTEKQIFMDIACFFIGKPTCMAINIWKGCGWRAELALRRLKEKCLVEEIWLDWEGYEFDDRFVLRMYNGIREFGREKAKQSDPPRLCFPQHHNNLEFKQILSKINSERFRCFHSIFDKSMGSHIKYFLGNSDKCNETSTALLWLELDLDDSIESTSLPSWIPLQYLQCLRIFYPQFQRLWENDAQAPLQLTEMVLHESSLAEFADSLKYLNCLEILVLIGRNEGMEIDGRSLSESLGELTELKTLVLRYFALNGEFTFLESDYTFGSCLSKLKTIELHGIKLASKVSISGEYCPSLESLYVDSLENLNEVDLTLLKTLIYLEFRQCKQLKRVLRSLDLAKLVTLNILDCGELEEFPSVAGLNSLERITIDGCGKLQNMAGIEELEGLKYLHLSALGEGTIWNCIHSLQRLPSEVISVIGKANRNAKSAVNANEIFERAALGEKAERGVRINKNSTMVEESVNSAIIVCDVVRAPYRQETNIISIPQVGGVVNSSVGGGEWMVTVVLFGQKKLSYRDLPSVTRGALIKKRWIMTVKGGDEGKTLRVLKRLIAKFYQRD